MAQIHLAAGGSNTAPYDTWAKAATSIATAVAAMAAGDDLLVDSAYTESPAGLSITFPGTAANPNRFMSGTHSGASGLDALVAGAAFTSSTTGCSVAGCVYAYGITLASSTASSMSLTLAGNNGNEQTWENSVIGSPGSGTSSFIIFGSSAANASSRVRLVRTLLKFGNTGQRVKVNNIVEIIDGGLASGSAAVPGIFNMVGDSRGATLRIDGFDASLAAASLIMVATFSAGGGECRMRGVKMPASWTGGPGGGNAAGALTQLTDYEAGGVNFPIWQKAYEGEAKPETTVKLTSSHSLKFISTANCKAPVTEFRGPEVMLNLTGGAAATVTFETLTDNVTLTDAEAWVEIDYYDTASSWLRGQASSRASPLATPANLTTSSAAWTTTGLTTPVKQKASVTFTPQQTGFAVARFVIGKPSTTVYVEPSPTVS